MDRRERNPDQVARLSLPGGGLFERATLGRIAQSVGDPRVEVVLPFPELTPGGSVDVQAALKARQGECSD